MVSWLAAAAAAAATPIEIRGTVLGTDGEPLAGAAASLLRLPSSYERGLGILAGEVIPPAVAESRTDADGRFRLVAPEIGMWTVRIDAAGHVPMRRRLAPLVEDTVVDEVRLRRDEPVRARVADRDDVPVAGAWLIAAAADYDIWRSGERRRIPWWPARRVTRTDASGEAMLARAADETLEIRAAAVGLLSPAPVESSGEAVRLTLTAGIARTLEVRGSHGRPLADVLVRVGESVFPYGVSDRQGRLSVTAPADAELAVVLQDARGARAKPTVAAPAGDEPGGVSVVTLPEPVTLGGRVLDAEERSPIAGAFVWLGQPGEHVRTGARGAFEIVAGDLPRGERFWVQAAAPGFFTGFARARPDDRPTLVLDPAAAIRGVVVDDAGEPVPGAAVRAWPAPDARLARSASEGPAAVADEQGRFRIGPLHTRFSYELEASHEGFAPARETRPALGTAAAAEEVVLVLEAGRVAFGRTVDPDGAPVAGAELELTQSLAVGVERRYFMMRQRGDESVASAASDAEGSFELRDLPAGTFDLTATAAGRAATELPGIEIPDDRRPVDLGDVVLQPGAEIAGQVTDIGGRPLDGAEVRISPSDPMAAMRMRVRMRGGEDPPVAVTGADGRFTIDDRRRGEQSELMISRAGFASRVIPGIEAPTPEPLRVTLEAAASISGRVVDPGGRAIPGARVGAQTVHRGFGGGVFTSPADSDAVTGEDGRFELEGVSPGPVQLTARADGWRSADVSDLEVAAGKKLEGVEIVLRRGAVVYGEVTGPDGRPVVGASVMVRSGSSGFSGAGDTDGDGRYRLEGVETGWQTVMVMSRELAPLNREVEVIEGENRLDFSFEEGVEIAGRIIDATGAPVAEARVHLSETGGGFDNRQAESGPGGDFSFAQVLPGVYDLGVEAEGYSYRQPIEPVRVDRSPVLGLVIELTGSQAIVGQVLGLEPGELARVQIWAQSETAVSQGQSRFDGSYRITGLGPGEVTITGRHTGSGSQAIARATIEPGVPETAVDLDFGQGVQLTGRVTRGGRPVAGARVYLQGTDIAGFANGVANQEGRFRLAALAPGRYRLHVSGPTGGGPLHERDLELLSDTDLEISVVGARLSGRVLDATSSEPIDGVDLTAETLETGTEASPFSFFRGGGRTDSRGFFRLDDVAPGNYRLRATKSGFATAELPVSVEAGLDLENLEILLTPSSGLVLWVQYDTGHTPRQVNAVLLDPTGRVVTGGNYRSADEGRVRITTAPPGSWELVIAAADSAAASIAVTVPGEEVPVVLGAGATLEIEVPALRGEESIAQARLIGADGRLYQMPLWGEYLLSEWPVSFGKAKIERLAAGAWTVRVEASDGRVWEGGASVVGGGTHQLVLPE